MRSFSITLISVVISFLSLGGFKNCDGRIFSFKMHHRFAEPVKKWAQFAGRGDWPARGSYEYYAELARHDRILHGRKLSQIESPLAFSDGNSTIRMNSLGFLHYTTVKLGTPGVKFLVALDTGSDLFWVPCECNRCAPTEGTTYASDFQLSIFYPERSSTCKRVACNNSVCPLYSKCQDTPSSCPYSVSYVSAETSSSGILVEDVLHLMTEGSHPEQLEAYIPFGCGQVQTGSFLNIAAPNGLLGLGMERTSVPSILSREGYIADSFSMCFGPDGVGRINFGDKGIEDQDETPFNINPSNPSYNISVSQIRVGTTLIDMNITALFDSGTSFTYLADPVYTRVIESFNLHAQDERHPPDSRIPFEYCYDMGSEANSSSVPSMSLTMKGGSQFAVNDPLAIISTQTEFIYCLAIVKSTEMNIIGQNFMTGYQVVFDREKLVLGWKKFNCYDMVDLNSFSPGKSNTTLGTAVAAGLDENRNPIRSSAPLQPHCRLATTDPFFFRYFLILLMLL